jgi:simple sugar transport system permease protein
MKLLRELMFPLIAVVAAFVVGAVIILIIGDNPINAYLILFNSALSWPDGIGYTLAYATPLIFTGLAVAVAFRCGLLNIGAEGQLYFAAMAVTWVGIRFGGVAVGGDNPIAPIANLPAVVLLPVCILVAILAGAFWGAIPGVLKAKFGSHEVIITIMLNFIALALISYFTQYHYKAPGPIMQTVEVGKAAQIPRMGHFIPGLPERIPLSLAFLLALIACAVVYLFLWRTKWGYAIRATGANPAAAEYGGISVKTQIVIAMAVSGGLAGMVAIGEVLGDRHRYYNEFSNSYGYTGIAVALLGRNHPVGVIFAALLFAILDRGAIFVDAFTEHISKDIVLVIKGLVVLFVAAEAFFRFMYNRRLQKAAK